MMTATHNRTAYRVANGDIYPSRFVRLDLANEALVLQASDPTVPLFGISQADIRGVLDGNPSLKALETRAATTGDNLRIFVPFTVDVLLVYGGIVNIGDRLMTDSSGRGITAIGANNWIIAVAQQSGNVGFVRKVTVIEPERLRA